MAGCCCPGFWGELGFFGRIGVDLGQCDKAYWLQCPRKCPKTFWLFLLEGFVLEKPEEGLRGFIPFSFLFWPPGGGFSSPSVPKPGRGSCAAAWGMWGQNDGENQKDFSLFLLNSLLSLCLPGPLSSKAHPGSVTSGVPSPPVPVTALGLCLASHGNLEFIFEGMRESLPSLCRQCHTREGSLCSILCPQRCSWAHPGVPRGCEPPPQSNPPIPTPIPAGAGGPWGGLSHFNSGLPGAGSECVNI